MYCISFLGAVWYCELYIWSSSHFLAYVFKECLLYATKMAGSWGAPRWPQVQGWLPGKPNLWLWDWNFPNPTPLTSIEEIRAEGWVASDVINHAYVRKHPSNSKMLSSGGFHLADNVEVPGMRCTWRGHRNSACFSHTSPFASPPSGCSFVSFVMSFIINR